MITEHMQLTSMTDVRQWAGDIVESWEGDYDRNVEAMSRAINDLKPQWGCVHADIDWDAVEQRAYALLDSIDLQRLIDHGGYSQRGAAKELQISERMMRYYCAGKQPVPRVVMLAMRHLVHCPSD